MNDKEIKNHLRDAGLHLTDAAKMWPKYKDTARAVMNAGLSRIDLVYDYVDRPMGEKEEDGRLAHDI